MNEEGGGREMKDMHRCDLIKVTWILYLLARTVLSEVNAVDVITVEVKDSSLSPLQSLSLSLPYGRHEEAGD